MTQREAQFHSESSAGLGIVIASEKIAVKLCNMPYHMVRSFAGAVVATALWLVLAPRSLAEELAVTGIEVDDLGRVVVTAWIPSGFHNTVLEIYAGAPAENPAQWRPMIAGSMDGRSASVVFRLPRPADFPASALARVRAGTAEAFFPAELNDPDLLVIGYDLDSGSISEDVKLDNLSALSRKFHEWIGLPTAQRDTNLVAYAKSLPRVSDAGFSALAGTVYINYPDGDTSVLIDNRGENGLSEPIVAAPDGALPLPAANSAAAAGQVAFLAGGGLEPGTDPPKMLPQSLDAICAYGLEPNIFPDSTPEVSSWLQSEGYSVKRYSSLTVDDLIDWGNRRLGVLFWQTHAGSLRPTKTSPDEMCIVTGQRATVELSQGRYKSMRTGPVWELLLAKRCDVANPANLDGIPIYALTRAFIQHHMKGMFAPHSVFALDACTGAHPDLANLFLDVSVGAGSLISWNNPAGVASGGPFLQLFDRLLGQNAQDPRSNPKERPFTMKTVERWMQNRGYDRDPSPPKPPVPAAQLVWYYQKSAPGYGLLPSIFRVLHEANDPQYNFTKFLIEGDFGKDPGPTNRLVSWGDSVAEILDWRQDIGIRVKPPGPPYPVGDIQVFIGNRRSNEVPLTEWTIPFTYTLTGEGSLQYRIEFSVKLRADVHRFRFDPEEVPRTSPIPFWQLADCTGLVTASGRYKPDPDTTITWSGGTTLHSSDPPTGDTNEISFGGVASLTTGRFDYFTPIVSGTFTQTTNGTSRPLSATLDGLFFPPLPLTIDLSTYEMPGKTVPAPFVSTENGVSAVLTWPTVKPSATPTPGTPR